VLPRVFDLFLLLDIGDPPQRPCAPSGIGYNG
jgi:hypothetical protein